MQAIRDLTASEIDCRVQSVKDNGLILLLYKDARVDMNILDETFGAENWQREHYECKGNLFCRIGVKINDEWVWKSDCGTESNTEAQKGEASDSFKRAGFNWGIGRELYTAPFIWVGADKCDIKGGKCYDTFKVQSITIKDKTITALTIYNEKKKCVAFTFGKNAPAAEPKKDEPKKDEPKDEVAELIKGYSKELRSKVSQIVKLTDKNEKEVAAYLCEKCGVAKATTIEDYLKLIDYADIVITDNHEGQD